MPVELLVVDDHQLIIDGISQIFRGTDITVAATASTVTEAIYALGPRNFDCVVLDVRLPEHPGAPVTAAGLMALSRIKMNRPHLPVLMFSGFDNPQYIAQAVSLGAVGYLLKTGDQTKLIESVRTAAAGGQVWTEAEMRKLSGSLSTPRAKSDMEAPLTQREVEVLQELSRGASNKEIAKALGISYETVKEHVHNILHKVGVSDRTQAAIWAVRKGVA